MKLANCHQHQHHQQQQVTMLSSNTNTERKPNVTMQQQQQLPSTPASNNCYQQVIQQNQQQARYVHHEPTHHRHTMQLHYVEPQNVSSHHHHHQTHDQRQQPQNSYQSPQMVVYTRPMDQQHQGQMGRQLPASVQAPPTPPSDDQLSQTVYLTPHDSRQQLQSSRVQTGAWVMQTIQMQQQQNQMPDAAPVHHHHHQQQQTTTIANYSYDIDDEFSDILSAPASPEPVHMIGGQQQQQPQLNDIYQQHDYNIYLPYNTSEMTHQHHNQHNNHQQQQQQQQQMIGADMQLEFDGHTRVSLNHHQHDQQQHFYQTQMQSNSVQVPYVMALSPDSSSLSTTSSSPSDHSLYQASPPMPRCQIARGSSQQQQQLQSHPLATSADNNHLKRQYHSLPLSPPVKSPGKEQMFPVSQQQQQPNAPASTRVILKPVNVGTQQRAQSQPANQPPSSQQTGATLANHHIAHHHHHPHHRSSPIHLWEFLKELLQQVETGSTDASIIRWLDRQRGVFKIEDSVRVAKLWGKRKNKPRMNYDKLSRSIRQYYKKGIMKKTDRSQRLVYQFCSAYCH